MKFWKHPNIFVRTVVLFLALIIPLYLLMFIINHTSGSILRRELASSMTARIGSYSELIDSEINHIAQMKNDLIYNEDLQKLSTVTVTLTDYERLSAINRLANRLLTFKDSSRLISDVLIYIPNVEKTIRASDYTDPMSIQEMNWIREVNTTRSPRILVREDQLVLALYDPPFSGARTNFYLQILLSREALLQTLQQVAAKEDGNFYMTDNGSTWLLSSDETVRVLPVELAGLLLEGESGFGSLKLGGEPYFTAYRGSKYLDTKLAVTVKDSTVFGRLDRYNQLLWISSLATLIVVVIFSYRMFLLIHRPLQLMVRALRKVEGGDLDIALSHGKHDEFRYLFGQFNRMVAQLRELIREAYEGRIHTQQAQLKQLQSQINPHFLYNTIFVLHRMAASYGLQDVTRFTDYLGKYLLFLTRTGSDTVLLADEWRHAVIYTEIQKVRFAERIEVVWPELPDTFRDVQVPRLILQPLLENAYKYGLEKRARGGLLRITTESGDSGLLLAVEDNGESLPDETLIGLKLSLFDGTIGQEITGLLNVHRRLQLFFGDKIGLQLQRSELGGLKVTMEIPHNERGQSHVPLADRG